MSSREAPADSHGDVGSSMLATHVKPIEPAASPTSPLAGSTFTENRPAVAPDPPVPEPRRVAPTHVRDPDRYHFIAEHGRGGLGRVSRAHDRELRRDVAIKELLSRSFVNESRFQREAMITARLEHPGIVPVHEAGRWPDGTPFYAMKLVSGRPLRNLIAERTTVEDRIDLLHHVVAVADAIAYAHDRHIIHRDLKPANIIVGNFGETIVIDWGLAKDLTTAEEPTTDGAPFRIQADDLTLAGSVLGTPGYMAPEQKRGESVDQRADVFAIGAMLAELCFPPNVPAPKPDQRRRMLHRAGIDPDLITIIEKALDPEPKRRYPHAGALAADLKAFKSGARIAARSYSLSAVLAHWIRRHRALTLSVTAVLALVATGIVFYIRGIANERDRVDAARVEAEGQRNSAVRAKDELMLQHARLLLHSDPSAADELLATYHGKDAVGATMARAQAQGLGVARLKTSPHTARVLLINSLPDGALLTMGGQTIVKTSMTGQSRTIASNVTPWRFAIYGDARNLVAYPCDPAAICILDAVTERQRPVSPDMTAFSPEAMSFSPTNHLLAAMSSDGMVAVWEIPDNGPPSSRSRISLKSARAILFLDDETIAAVTNTHIELLHLDAALGSLTALHHIVATDIADLDVNHEQARLAIATNAGFLRILDARTGAIRDISLCKSALNSVAFIGQSSRVVYACQDGNVGVWDEKSDSSVATAHIDGGARTTAASRDGRFAMFGGSSGLLLVYSRDTDLFTSYLGHGTSLTYLLPPSEGFPFLTSGDSMGMLRVWPLPPSSVRSVIRSTARLISAIFLSGRGPILAVGTASVLRWFSLNGEAGELQGHDAKHVAIETADIEPRFLMYGYDTTIELWSLLGAPKKQVLKTDHDAVTAVRYLSDRASFVSAGRDGRVVLWSADGLTHHELARLQEPIETLQLVPNTNNVLLLRGASGAIWKLEDARLDLLVDRAGTISRYVASHDGRWLAVGTTQGVLRIYSIQTSSLQTRLQFPVAIRDLAFRAHDDKLAVAAGSSVYLLEAPSAPNGQAVASTTAIPKPWINLQTSIASIEFSDDGKWFSMIGRDKTLWFHALDQNRWICELVNSAEFLFGYFTKDGKHYLATDAEAHVLLVAMDDVLRENLDSFPPVSDNNPHNTNPDEN
jgi:eukaryotic-like serine/threonine-protein kinase